jgi:hypothetical protein
MTQFIVFTSATTQRQEKYDRFEWRQFFTRTQAIVLELSKQAGERERKSTIESERNEWFTAVELHSFTVIMENFFSFSFGFTSLSTFKIAIKKKKKGRKFLLLIVPLQNPKERIVKIPKNICGLAF